MQHRLVGLTLAAAVVLGGCGRKNAAMISPDDALLGTRWRATLSTTEAFRGVIQARGTALLTSEDSGRRTRIDVEIGNVVPGGQHPWALRPGSCGAERTELARFVDGNTLRINSDGTARANRTIELSFPRSGEYHLVVLASADNAEQVLACGNFSPPVIAPR